MFEDNDVQTLINSGLTSRQARVFLTLAESGMLTARSLTQVLKFPRQDVYQVLTELQKLDLVEKYIGTPTKFGSIPIQSACSVLLDRSRRKTADLQRKLETLASNFQKIINERTNDDSEPNLKLIPEGQAFTLRIKKSIEKAQKSVDVISPRNFLQGLFYLSETLQRAVHRNVIIRFLVDDVRFVGSQLKILQDFMNSPCFRIKTISNGSTARFCVYDNKEVTLVISQRADFSKSSLIWSDCPSFVKTYQEYYETLWFSGEEPNWNESSQHAQEAT